jgi:hypothetical protein
VNALLSIIKSEGFKGIYRGYGATLVSFGTYSAIYFLIYENLKSFFFDLFIEEKYFKKNQRTYLRVSKKAFNLGKYDGVVGGIFVCKNKIFLVVNIDFLKASIISNPLSISKLRF